MEMKYRYLEPVSYTHLDVYKRQVLNNGLEFQEASNTSVEMQLNENKQTNSNEYARNSKANKGRLEELTSM